MCIEKIEFIIILLVGFATFEISDWWLSFTRAIFSLFYFHPKFFISYTIVYWVEGGDCSTLTTWHKPVKVRFLCDGNNRCWFDTNPPFVPEILSMVSTIRPGLWLLGFVRQDLAARLPPWYTFQQNIDGGREGPTFPILKEDLEWIYFSIDC